MYYTDFVQEIDDSLRKRIEDFLLTLKVNGYQCVEDENSSAVVETILDCIVNGNKEILYKLRELLISSYSTLFLSIRHAAELQVVLGAIYIASGRLLKDATSVLDYYELFTRNVAVCRDTCCQFSVELLADNQNLIHSICADMKKNTINFRVLLRDLWKAKDYKKLNNFCDIYEKCEKADNKTDNDVQLFKHLSKSRLLYGERNYKAATAELKEIDEGTIAADVKPIYYLESAIMLSWQLKDMDNTTRMTCIDDCKKYLDKSKDLIDEDDELENTIDFQREFLEMELGSIAEENLAPQKAMHEGEFNGSTPDKTEQSENSIITHYCGAFTLFWNIWKRCGANEDSKKKFVENSDVVNHIWCTIKTIRYNEDNMYVEEKGVKTLLSVTKRIQFIQEIYGIEAKLHPGKKNRLIEYRKVIEYINNMKADADLLEVKKCLLISLLNALELLHSSRIREIDNYSVFYYTSLDNLRLLMEDETDECKYRLPMFNAEHMNDPEEGCIIRNMIPENWPCGKGETNSSWFKGVRTNGDEREIYEKNNVYFKSFYSIRMKNDDNTKNGKCLEEFLPMWDMYGNKAAGCCVLLNCNATFSNAMRLRKVYYLDHNNNLYRNDDEQIKEIKEEYDRIESQLGGFIDNFKRLLNILHLLEPTKNPAVRKELIPILNSIIERVSYIFKRDTYKYENEVRLIRYLDEEEMDCVHNIPGTVPKTYIYHERGTCIDEIILGPKLTNPNDYLPYLYKQGDKMWTEYEKKNQKTTEGRVMISKSALQYR